MASVISGILTVPSFSPTDNLGEYRIEGAIYGTQTDLTMEGAYALHEGMVVYVPATDINTYMPMYGVVHRYKITQVEALDQNTINATIVWDEDGDEVDTVTHGATCIITEVTPNKKLGYAIEPNFYPDLASTTVSGASNNDLINIIDKDTGGKNAYVHIQSSLEPLWVIQHNRKSMNFVYTIFDDTQSHCLPDNIQVVDENQIVVHLLEGMAGRAIFSFV